ncbi:Flp pilus assembly protein TadG [Actinomyces bovis]|uniref:Flp pilus assembly protein TadG n=1 Tax=Actinomyces bovis TaxID=1658 RepID=A0ABY1VNF4_9ACTO|nr:TadE/TadG family type IV pilus assembly protein [Actinomyces bovis]SPT53628.1 Flp pilus assembly protein TadG [Actinomyces bovis]VEG55686.1 Flp pilus assembly protein TadG [Actinomyces israelii]
MTAPICRLLTRSRGLLRREEGNNTVEMIVIAPMLIVIIMLAVAGGRYVSAEGAAQAAARDAARAASLQRNEVAARSAANASLAASQSAALRCTGLTSTGGFRPGGTVRVSVTCRVELADLGIGFLPGTAEISSNATALIDPLRGTGG